ncbi:hypothetical protein MY1884_008026 [Beauveria asiatica]
MQLSSVPCIMAAALALASIGHASPINQPKEGLERHTAYIDKLTEGLRLSHVTAPKAKQLRAERKGNEPKVYDPRAERKNDDSVANQTRAERKDNEPEPSAERKGNEPEANQPRAERKDNDTEVN